MPFFVSAFLLAGILFSLASCSRPGGRQGSRSTLVVAMEGSPVTLDPRLAMDAYSARAISILYNGLLKKTPDLTLVGDLAERWEMPNDTSYVFFLRKGVKFHDGTDLTAQDVQYTFESLLDPGFPSPLKESYSKIATIEVLSPYTVKFKLKEVFAPFLTNLTLGIIPKTVAEKPGNTLASLPVGSGPFRLTRWEPDESLTFEAFGQYFEGRPQLESIVYRIIPDETIRLLEVKTGNLDLVQNALSPDAIETLTGNPRIRIIKERGTNYTYLGFNLQDPVLKNQKVRAAIALAIDRMIIIRQLLKGLAEPATGVLAPGNWAYEPDVAAYGYDPESAKRLLDEAGFPDPDGAKGSKKRFSLLFKTSQNEQSKRIAEVIQQNLAEAGIGLEIRSYEWGTFFSDIKSGNFQLYSLQWVGITDPDIYYNLFHSLSVPPAGANRGRYINKDLDLLLEAGRRTTDLTARREIYRKIQKVVASDLPYVSLWYQTNVAVISSRVKGFVLSPDGSFISLRQVSLAPP
ncbi:MAG: ABC transporter substrate-binding protein [bacterium]